MSTPSGLPLGLVRVPGESFLSLVRRVCLVLGAQCGARAGRFLFQCVQVHLGSQVSGKASYYRSLLAHPAQGKFPPFSEIVEGQSQGHVVF